jgi:hypothetical protein
MRTDFLPENTITNFFEKKRKKIASLGASQEEKKRQEQGVKHVLGFFL